MLRRRVFRNISHTKPETAVESTAFRDGKSLGKADMSRINACFKDVVFVDCSSGQNIPGMLVSVVAGGFGSSTIDQSPDFWGQMPRARYLGLNIGSGTQFSYTQFRNRDFACRR